MQPFKFIYIHSLKFIHSFKLIQIHPLVQLNSFKLQGLRQSWLFGERQLFLFVLGPSPVMAERLNQLAYSGGLRTHCWGGTEQMARGEFGPGCVCAPVIRAPASDAGDA